MSTNFYIFSLFKAIVEYHLIYLIQIQQWYYKLLIKMIIYLTNNKCLQIYFFDRLIDHLIYLDILLKFLLRKQYVKIKFEHTLHFLIIRFKILIKNNIILLAYFRRTKEKKTRRLLS